MTKSKAYRAHIHGGPADAGAAFVAKDNLADVEVSRAVCASVLTLSTRLVLHKQVLDGFQRGVQVLAASIGELMAGCFPKHVAD